MAQEILALFNEAVRLERNGEWERAETQYKLLLEKNPDYHLALQNLGVIYAKQGKHADAIPLFSKAYKLHANVKNCYNLAVSLYKHNETEKAISFLKQTLSFEKKFISAHLLLAQAYQKLENDEKTEVYLNNVIKIEPNHKSALGGLAMFYYERNRFPESLKMIERYLILYPGNAQLKIIQSEILAKQGNYKASANLLTAMVKEDVGFTHFNESLQSTWQEDDAIAKESLERIQSKAKKKLKEFKTKLELSKENPDEFSPPDPQEALDLSLLYLFNGNPEKAMQYLVFAQKMKEKSDSDGIS
ncbi:anaphase-promoting protein [Leptospira biflexa]|jgi:predicted Zn-dependent protease|uniref:Putative TPR-repeat-containing protein n=1 Tax=Leptospira biflexa serovar Patoc (strain Patoc 1 / ATCC 23582 / Paris) TaxID=456481 RepID=B0SQQ9_LEPBP|nr:tetratricopeptide repeat protein [Leptospira biflexa]ABZ95598.1 TPR-repeat-containing protein [Leptospira biflexa serovar Patoc strain 'Patoc 1 (Ames)']ABZ99306.1 Putative TPR-repeat-containing protein [Leptospira biflexa serovar Patoc strain 'Patoc 1 (Paris)']TGM35906.1 anaphase-promoting protein [Leptospira biflexa]TGM37276.1 anaphase-promoting protein [Leptospira biflexa]TGM46816.1 anaphase-promoting protein [Leptospira biflexa]